MSIFPCHEYNFLQLNSNPLYMNISNLLNQSSAGVCYFHFGAVIYNTVMAIFIYKHSGYIFDVLRHRTPESKIMSILHLSIFFLHTYQCNKQKSFLIL